MFVDLGSTDLNAFQKFICCLVTASALLASTNAIALSQPAQSEECGFLVAPQEFNTTESDGKIVIGQVRGRSYIVVLTYNLQENLPALRACVPDAFLTSSRLGSYMHIASFNNYRDARELAKQIESSLDIDVRVIHRSRLGR